MEGSCEVKGINCIIKPKIIFRKYANSVNNSTKIHICSGGQTGLIIENMGGWNLRRSSKVLSRSAHLKFLSLLCRFALLCLGCCGLSGCWSRGAPGVHEELYRE